MAQSRRTGAIICGLPACPCLALLESAHSLANSPLAPDARVKKVGGGSGSSIASIPQLICCREGRRHKSKTCYRQLLIGRCAAGCMVRRAGSAFPAPRRPRLLGNLRAGGPMR
ncbi:hypothetical protein GQ53DRAFT_744047 [Thozetella sp. PMI_491]|nr:hypothetical protein GQ53DRAFT_744047 [Thozetella sp. PMI_491]